MCEISKCELCETIINKDKLVDDRSIIQTSENTYELAVWKPINNKEIDSVYKIFATYEITECPDCKRKLNNDTDALDITIELDSWAYAKKNRSKARKIYKIARKYEKIWEER